MAAGADSLAQHFTFSGAAQRCVWEGEAPAEPFHIVGIENSGIMNDKGCMPEPDEINAQLKLIAKMLVEARAPLIYGLTQLTVEAQELAVELAMCLRGAIDTPRGARIPARGTSLQLHGEARTTLGELRQYADLLVFVGGTEPAAANFVCQSGLLDRTELIIFHIHPSTAFVADSYRKRNPTSIHFTASEFAKRVHEFGTSNAAELQQLRHKLGSESPSDPVWEELLAAWQAAKYPILIYKKDFLAHGDHNNAWISEKLERAVLQRARVGRAAAWIWDSGEGIEDELYNHAGAEYVLTARTGYPAAVQCFNGRAEYLPGVTDAHTLLIDGVVDATLFLGDCPQSDTSATAKKYLQQIPRAMIASQKYLEHSRFPLQVQCCELKDEQGTIVREDGIPIPLAAKVAPVDSAEKILHRLLELIREPALAAETGATR